MVTYREIAEECDLELDLVRNILNEDPETVVDDEVEDRVFSKARELGYDFRKLKIGKRMNFRKKVLLNIIEEIEEHPDWEREEIREYLDKSVEMVNRVTNRAFQDEFETGEQT